MNYLNDDLKNVQRKILRMCVLILGTCSLGASMAQPGGSRGGPISLSEFDTDGDGLVSEEEFYVARGNRMAGRASEGRQMRNAPNGPPFEEFDVDGDGYLTEQEIATGQQAQMQRRMGKGAVKGAGPQGGGRGAGQRGKGRNMPTFDQIDLDGDGMISREEFEKHQSGNRPVMR